MYWGDKPLGASATIYYFGVCFVLDANEVVSVQEMCSDFHEFRIKIMKKAIWITKPLNDNVLINNVKGTGDIQQYWNGD